MPWDHGSNGLITDLDDGLYAVVRDAPVGSFVAAFIVHNGRVRELDCAPILRRHLPYWMRQARRIG